MTFATSDGGLTSSQAPPPSERGTPAAVLTPNAGGGVPPLLLKADDRAEDGTYPRLCPYCLSQAVEETRLIKRNTPDEREQTFTNCISTVCQGGRPRSGQNAGRWPWSEFGSVEGTFAVGGKVDELVNGGTEQVENTTPEFDAHAYLRSALSVCVEWDEGAVKDRLADAKRELAHGRRWSPEVSQMIVGKLLSDYWEQFPNSAEAPF